VVYNTEPPLDEEESMRGSIHTTRPSPVPTASAPPSPRHATPRAAAPTAIVPTIAEVGGAFTSIRLTCPSPPSLLAAAINPGEVGENTACQQLPVKAGGSGCRVQGVGFRVKG
jgi:hypothetical protein